MHLCEGPETGEIWSLTWQPVGKATGSYRVAHGFGYTRAEAKVEDIDSSVLFFVPLDDDQEIWRTSLKNTSGRARKLSLYAYVELALGHALVDLINQCDDQHFNRSHFDQTLNALFSYKNLLGYPTKRHSSRRTKEWDQWTFFTSEPVEGMKP
ncbi:MAG: hypothetical protein IPN29_02270 [Saprospiraceae bacterium]|nr:hypothetical protein [Saprospiraceae bacterium]